jgi:hypothetical protein
MPRNVSRSPHELVTYTLRFIFTLRASARRAGRILADRIEFILSVFQRRVKSENHLMSARAAEKSAAPFVFGLVVPYWNVAQFPLGTTSC